MAFDEEQKKCGGITLGGIITLIISICMIVLGFNYYEGGDLSASREPCMQNIPIALIFGGCFFILAMVLRVVIQRCCRRSEDGKICGCLNFACKFSVILIYDALVTLIYVIWLIIFTVWTMEIHGHISFVDGDSSTSVIADNIGSAGANSGTTYQCNVYLYDTSFWMVIILWIVFLCTITCGLLAKFCNCFYDIICCKPCKGSAA